MNPLVLQGVTKHWPGFDLGPVDLDLPRGYVTGLVGANGAGKTTLLKVALGLVHPDAGSVDLVDRGRVGVVFDTPALPAAWRVREVASGLAPFYRDWDQAEFDRMADRAGLDGAQKVGALSRGMGMRLQLAVALAHHPELLLFDEPTSGLDPLARAELLDQVGEFMVDPSHTVLFSSHITSDLEKVADHLVVMGAGQVVAAGPLDEVLDGFRVVRGPRASLEAVRPLVLGLREHHVGWEGLMRTEDTLAVGPEVVVEAPDVEQVVVAVAKQGRAVVEEVGHA